MELREKILEGTVIAFNEKGIKFTMDELAKILGMSKKTIYTVFSDKNQLLLAMVDRVFDAIKDAEQAVVDDVSSSTIDKVRRILCAFPEGYKDVDFRQLYSLKERYPQIYSQVENRLENGWENTIGLIKQGIDEGVIRDISIPMVKLMLESSVERFFQRDILVASGLSYKAALEEVVDILLFGIEVKA